MKQHKVSAGVVLGLTFVLIGRETALSQSKSAIDSIFSDIDIIILSDPEDRLEFRAQCALGLKAELLQDQVNLSLSHPLKPENICLAAQQVTASDTDGNKAFYVHVSQRNSINLAPKALLEALANQAANGNGLPETAADIGFTLGYEPSSELTRDVPYRDYFLSQAAGMTPERAKEIYKLSYNGKDDGLLEVNGQAVPEVIAAVVAGVRNGQIAHLDR